LQVVSQEIQQYQIIFSPAGVRPAVEGKGHLFHERFLWVAEGLVDRSRSTFTLLQGENGTVGATGGRPIRRSPINQNSQESWITRSA